MIYDGKETRCKSDDASNFHLRQAAAAATVVIVIIPLIIRLSN